MKMSLLCFSWVVAFVQHRARSRLGITSVATEYDCKTGRQRRRILDEKCR